MGKHAQTTVTTPAVQYGAEGSVLRSLPTSPSAAEGILKEAVWWIDAAHSSANQQIIENLGWGGSVLNTTCGSTQSADSNDPKYLDWQGENYVYLPGVAGNYLSVPDEAALDITGDIDIRVHVALDNWTPGAARSLATKWTTGGLSYLFRINSSNGLEFLWSADNSAVLSKPSTATLGSIFADGVAGWVRVTLDVDNGAAGNDVKFYTSSDGVSWSQLGATVTTAGLTSIYSSTTEVRIGVHDTNTPIAGKVHRAQILNGINGTPVLDVDTSVIASGSATSFRARTGQTVTINRSTSGRKAVAVTNPLWLFGTDDYMEVQSRWLEHTGTNYVYVPGVARNLMSVPDAAALDITDNIDIRVHVALDDWTPPAFQTLLSKMQDQYSYLLGVNANGTLNFQWSNNGSAINSATSTVAVSATDASAIWVRVTLDVDNGASGRTIAFYTSTDGSTWTQLGSDIVQANVTSIFAGTSPVTIGGYSLVDSNFPAAGKIYRAQIYNGIDGTKVLDVDTSVVTETSTSFTAVTGQTVTINRSGSTYQTAPIVRSGYLVAGPTYTFRPSTYSLLDFGASDSFTVVAVMRQWATPTNVGSIISKFTVAPGWRFRNNSKNFLSQIVLQDGTSTIIEDGSPHVTGTLNTMSAIIDRLSAQTTVFRNDTTSTPTSISGLGSVATYSSLKIGAHDPAASSPNDMEIVSAAIFRRVLTTTEISEISRYYQERVK